MPEPTTKQSASAEKKDSLSVATFRTPLGVLGFVTLVLVSGYSYTQWRLTDLRNAIIDAKHPTVTTTKTTATPSTPKPKLGSATPSPQSSPNSTTTVVEQQTVAQDKLVTFEKDRADLEAKMMTGVVQLLGGFFVAATAYVSWQNLKQTKNNVEIAEKNLRETEDKNVTERYVKAVEQLGSNQIVVRFSGIYALERIAKDSSKYHWTIMNVLSSFIREESLKEKESQDRLSSEGSEVKIARDVQAALTVICMLNDHYDPPKGEYIDLTSANLSGANLSNAKLSGADLSKATLERANLSKAILRNAKLCDANLSSAVLTEVDFTETDLTEVDFTKADLTGMNFTKADLTGESFSPVYRGTVKTFRGATLIGAKLQKAVLVKVDFTGADLTASDLRGATLHGAKFVSATLHGAKFENAELMMADFTGAKLDSATFTEAKCYKAIFKDADLCGADFCKAKSLTSVDFKDAKYLEQAKFD